MARARRRKRKGQKEWVHTADGWKEVSDQKKLSDFNAEARTPEKAKEPQAQENAKQPAKES